MGMMDSIAVILARLPLEKWLSPRPDPMERWNRLERVLEAPKTSNLPPLEAVSRPTSTSLPTALPTTEETIQELKRRLGKELYRMELDLQSGARIAGRPCDCIGAKHNLGLEATAEELMSYETNPIYGQIIDWLHRHELEFEPEEIAKKPPEYYQSLAPEVRRFRKEVMGTERLGTPSSEQTEELTLDEAKRLAAQEAEKEVERLWQSQEKP